MVGDADLKAVGHVPAASSGWNVRDWTACATKSRMRTVALSWTPSTGSSSPGAPRAASLPCNRLFADRTWTATCAKLNSDYDAKRTARSRASIAPDWYHGCQQGTFENLLRQKGKLGGQHKVPRLSMVPRVGQSWFRDVQIARSEGQSMPALAPL